MTDTTAVLSVTGRSLWADAWARLKANRAAVVSAFYLALMIIACVAGPWLSPHEFSAIYQDYVRVPPSLASYPRPETIEKSLQTVAARARVELGEW
ncbi:MAG TPA: ABC transporter permease, partial [Aestuariivirgaceae bacterium]|nr:ABC transporter permease [Aestuariivirgaceae bacterium]